MKVILICAVAVLSAWGEPAITYYLVDATMTLPGGQKAGSSLSLVKRTLDREQSRIEERVVYLRGQEPAREVVTTIKVEGSRVKLSSEGAFDGEGELIGDPWHWTGMNFIAKLPQGGQVVRGEDRYTDSGISADKRIYGPGDKLVIQIRESGTVISEVAYEQLRGRLLK